MASGQQDDQGKIEGIWRNILNEKELQHSCLNGMKEGVLLVNVDSAIFLHHMNIKKWKILKRVKDEYPEINQIRFKLGKVK